uniref:Transmembrane protein 26 n=1 Tax=Glossina palpalis gambiensis TaxID=67801 RepID=A0A1B0BVV5_9MUSC
MKLARIISTIKATLTRLIFGAHSAIAIWQVVYTTDEIIYWSLGAPLLFCPSVFLYLASIVPAIWLLELNKVQRRLEDKRNPNNATITAALDKRNADTNNATIIPAVRATGINESTWITVIEQFLMLILIVGRWMLPKGDLTRDQLSQLLLVYIGTAADIIEFFDSYKDDTIAQIKLLVYLTLGIWSWSLLQFTIVLSATRSRRPRGGSSHQRSSDRSNQTDCCCGIDVWGIVLNVILQDAPFLTFRLLIIYEFDIISYMNVFFTCKNSLVILLQLYRLYVVNAEYWEKRREQKAANKARQYKSRRRLDDEFNGIYMISNERGTEIKRKIKRVRENSDEEIVSKKKPKKDSKPSKKHKRKDTGYSTASSQNLYATKASKSGKSNKRKEMKPSKKSKRARSRSPFDNDIEIRKSRHGKKSDKLDKKKLKKIEAVIEEPSSSSSNSDSSNSTLPSYEVINEKKSKTKRHKRSSTSSSTSSDTSSSESS